MGGRLVALATMKCSGDFSSVMSVEFEDNNWKQYWDDISGKELRGAGKGGSS